MTMLVFSRNKCSVEVSVQTDSLACTDDSRAEVDGGPGYPNFMAVFKSSVTPAFRSLDVLEAMSRQHNFQAYDHFVEIRESVKIWSSMWGGVSAWSDTLEILFYRALARGPERTDYFIRRLCAHEMKGRELLRSLEKIEGCLPNDATLVSTLWCYQQELVIEVVRGLTIVQTRLPIMRRWDMSSVGPSQVFHTSVVNSFTE